MIPSLVLNEWNSFQAMALVDMKCENIDQREL